MTVRRIGGAHRVSSGARAENPGLASRLAAVEILLRVDQQSGYADALLGSRILEFQPPDRRLITRLVLGTIAWQGRLDHELRHLTGRDPGEIQPAALAVMRMGLLQLRFLDRIPQHAVVDTSVSIAKRIPDARKAAGFVNAVMRRATRESAPMPDRARDEIGHLAIAWSHPRWMVEKFIAWLGFEAAERLLKANNEAAPNTIRLNLARGTRAEILARLEAEGFEFGGGGRAPETVVLSSAPRFDSACYRDGLFHAQSEASQMVARMLAPRRAATVLDCAAAPGGKATHLAELVGSRGRVIALDLNLRGLRHARDLARRLRHPNLNFVRADMTARPPFAASNFDYVLLDAPCTGLGTLREHPEIRWRLKPDDPARMATIQTAMIANAASLVRRGGAMVYSVCSIAPEEGADVIDRFLAAHREFEVDSHPPNHDELKDFLDPRGFMQTRPDLFPERGGLDGFFAARLIRR